MATRWTSYLARFLASCVLAAGLLLAAGEGRARLHPYYVLKGASFGGIAPRILFVLDTSGSMAWKAQKSVADCVWNECETATNGNQSRIAAARTAIKTVVLQRAEQAKFALMTFDQQTAPNTVPATCNGARFKWIDTYSDNTWSWLEQYPGYRGRWMLCDGEVNRPHPYLRWNNLGVGPKVTTNRQVGSVPSSPLISTVQADMTNSANATRKVQWFPKFLGVRAHMDCFDSGLYGNVISVSAGDYGSTKASIDANVCGHDFYYWPYVDGFPGYSQHSGTASSSCSESNGKTVCTWHKHGVVQQDNSKTEAMLYGPFYLQLDKTDVNPNYWGPRSEAEADAMLLTHTSSLVEGGVDVEGSTPWTAVIGTIPASPPKNNAIFAHPTVSSYLKFVTQIETPDICAPTVAVLVTDGEPDCAYGSNPDCTMLYSRLSDLRRVLNVKTYVVGFFEQAATLNQMACASAGACSGNKCTNPCSGTPTKKWDTCRDPSNPNESCSYLANSPAELLEVLDDIVKANLALDIGSGAGTTIHDFGASEGPKSEPGEVIQTKLSAYTEYPGWRGHVQRSLCEHLDTKDLDQDGNTDELAPYCRDVAFTEAEETFGPCPQSRSWDAGECLRQTHYANRRLYTTRADNKTLIAISDGNGKAGDAFQAELDALGLLPVTDKKAAADAIAQFIAGKDWPGGWKLPGLANSAPIVVRRIPKTDENYRPQVAIRDPHCGGRMFPESLAHDVPKELQEFSNAAWDATLSSPSPHYEYQEAVLVGDDLGVLHAFQLDSGNELWGFMPRFLLDSAVRQSRIGAKKMGQPDKIDDHVFGIASTVNQGWVWDEAAKTFRHLAVFGLGAGGAEWVTLDLSHMSPVSPKQPFQVLWTSEDVDLKATYDAYNGETWARPALTYELDNFQLTDLPRSHLVMGSGYVDGNGAQCHSYATPAACDAQAHCAWAQQTCTLNVQASDKRGRVLMLADALTGTLHPDGVAVLPTVTEAVYESYFGSVVDPTVASHCRSKFWAEMEETYVADPAGRLFRWDLGHPVGQPNRDHRADFGGKWNGVATPVFRFPACQGNGDTCTVNPTNKGDVFTFGVAVTASDRVDDLASPGDVQETNRFLIAMISGTPHDDKIDWSSTGNDFHSSVYLLVDDHAGADEHGGFDIPAGAPKMTVAQIGSRARYLRLALSDIPRTRTFTPYPGAPTYSESGRFSRRARPIRAPRMVIRGVVDKTTVGTQQPKLLGAEVVRVEFQVYEPGTSTCDSRFYDPVKKEWYFDEGATYKITFELGVDDVNGFDFSGYQGNAKNGADFPGGGGLVLVGGRAQQLTEGACADGNCGPLVQTPTPIPCDNNTAQKRPNRSFSVPLTRTELVGFDPVE